MSATRAPIDSSAPGASKRPGLGSRESGTKRMPATKATSATGTLMRKTEDQSKYSSSRPPNSGPRPTPIAAVPAHTPIALARSSRGKTFVMIDSVAGMISAPPTPIRARTAMSCVDVSTKRTARLERPNTAMPVCSARLRPKRSPSMPIVSSRPAKETR